MKIIYPARYLKLSVGLSQLQVAHWPPTKRSISTFMSLVENYDACYEYIRPVINSDLGTIADHYNGWSKAHYLNVLKYFYDSSVSIIEG
ncbi:MAG: hypothetical protein NT096_07335 [Proteobacteria bacterium]|nr:hypothetical protein [Pseudomonadota bacterium]